MAQAEQCRGLAAGGEARRSPEEAPRGATGGDRGLDWPGLMRAGLRGLGLKPAEFWDMTPAELALMLGIEFSGSMNRSRLDDLMAQFPDRPAHQDD